MYLYIVLITGRNLNKLGDIHAIMPEVIAEATESIAMYCYGSKKTENILEVREEVWSRKMNKCQGDRTRAEDFSTDY